MDNQILDEVTDDGLNLPSTALNVSTTDDAPVPEVLTEPAQKKAKKTPNASSNPRFKWIYMMEVDIIDSLLELKTRYELKGIDFEADLVKLYYELRVLMAEKKPSGEFGPIMVQEIDENNSAELIARKRISIASEKKAIKKGYERVKEKTKQIRQNYRKAVTVGRRSGSGRLVEENWDVLKNIWGGSPATTSIANAAGSIFDDDANSQTFDEQRDDVTPDEDSYGNNDGEGEEEPNDENEGTQDDVTEMIRKTSPAQTTRPQNSLTTNVNKWRRRFLPVKGIRCT